MRRLALALPSCAWVLAACGDNGATPDAAAAPDAAGSDLTTCATWAAAPAHAVTPADDHQSMFPTLAWSGTGYVAQWYDERAGNDAYMAALDPAGDIVGAVHEVSTEVLIADTPTAAWSGAELGVAWSDLRTGDFEIQVARVTADGQRRGADVNVSQSASPSQRPAIVASPDGWWVSWVEIFDDVNEEIMTARLGSDGQPVGAPVRVTTAAGSSYAPTFAAAPAGARLAWHDQRTGGAEIWTAPVDAPEAARGLGVDGLVPAMAWGDGAWGVAYHSQRTPNWTIYFARVDASGALLDEVPVSSGAYYATFASVVWTGHAWVIAWQEHTGADTDRILARRVAADGRLVGDPIVVVDSPMVGQIHLAAGGPDLGAIWQDAHARTELAFTRIVCTP